MTQKSHKIIQRTFLREDGYYRQCIKCDKILKLDELNFRRRNRKSSMFFNYECGDCHKIYLKEHWNKVGRSRRYGLSNDGYNQMLIDQEHGCAICKRTDQILYVDHDHKDGKIRGLLCNHCNVALGALKDDINLFERSILYLKMELNVINK